MRVRPLVMVCALALVPVTACGAEPLSPLPVQATASPVMASPVPSLGRSAPPSTGVRPPSRAASTSSPPARTTTPAAPPQSSPSLTSPSSSSVCLGAVRYDVNLQATVLDLVTSMCFHTGGVLRLFSIGPGLVTAVPESLTAQSYEAGVVDIRFLRPGTVTVTVPLDERTYTIEVVVIR